MSSVIARTEDRYYGDILRQQQQEAMNVSRSLAAYVSGASELQRVPRYNLHHHDSLDRLHQYHQQRQQHSQQQQLPTYLLDMFHQQHVPIAPHPLMHQQQHQSVRKRPKYSRSKLGCLSCRVRKVKCDEAHPVCTRCAHSQRECTWPVDPPRSKKHQHQAGQQQSSQSDTASSSRPSTASASDSGAGPSQDAGWGSDTGAAGGVIRRVPSAHDRIANHARIPSISRGRDIQPASATLSRSRDQSPNPFAYNVAHLPQQPINNHHRSASTSSTASTSSATSSLPYPLVPQSISTSIIGLSSSRNSSPASTHFAQSPTVPWHSASDQRPGTSSGGLSAGFGGMDINAPSSSSAFATGAFDPNTGFPNQGFMTSGGFDSSPLDVNFAFGGSAQTFDGLTNSFAQGAVDASGNPYDSLQPQTGDLDASSNFLAQLNQSMDANNHYAFNASTSSDPSEINSQSPIDSLDPRALSSTTASTSGAIPLAQPQPNSFHQSGFGAPNPLPASRFGIDPQASGTTPTPTSPIYGSNNHTHPLVRFGTNLDLQQHPHLQQQDISGQATYGATISPSTTPHPTEMYQQHASTSSSNTRPHSNLTPNLLPAPKTRSTSLEFGSNMARTHPPHRTSFSEDTNNSLYSVVEEPEAAVESGYPQELVCSPSRMDQDISLAGTGVERSEHLQTEAGQGAGLYMAGVQAGAQGVEGSSMRHHQMNNGQVQDSSNSSMSPSNHLQSDLRQSLIQGERMELSGEDEMGLSRSKTPTNVTHTAPAYLSPRQQTQDQYRQSQLLDRQYGLPQSPLSPSSVPQQHHVRNRSDTITPFTVNADVSMYGTTPEELASEQVVDRSNENQWNGGGLSNLAGLVGNQMWQGRAGERSMVVRNNPDPIEPFFKSVQERNLIRHYCQNSTLFNMALPSSFNPILSVHLPIILSNTATMPKTPSPPTSPESLPPSPTTYSSTTVMKVGAKQRVLKSPVHASIEALRLSLLGVASIHQSYLLAKSGPENATRAREMWNLAVELRVMSSTCLGIAVKNLDGCKSDAALGACVSIALIDIFAGGHKYQSNMALAKTLVTLRGGPAAIVKSSASVPGGLDDVASTSSFEGPLHFMEGGSANDLHAKKGLLISTGRLLLEILAVYELFSTLTSGEEPTLLHPNNSLWWFEGDKSNYHLFSVEKVFGMSRSIIELFSRVSTFLNKYRYRSASALAQPVTRFNTHGNLTPMSTRPSSPALSLSALTEIPPQDDSPLAVLHSEASSLMLELETWSDFNMPIAIHPRVEYGNEAHRNAMIILLMREAFNIPVHDHRVQRCCELVLTACEEASNKFGMGVDLTWPVIIAGCQATTSLFRSMTALALEAFRKQCCFEIDTSQQIITEVWRRMDHSLPGADLRSVIDDFNLRVLIL